MNKFTKVLLAETVAFAPTGVMAADSDDPIVIVIC